MGIGVEKEVRLSTEADISPHPFLTGIHRPMTEELTLTELEVRGELPAHLAGRYARIGPNPIGADPQCYHWFAGDGMIHSLALQDGRALWYRNRWIRSNAVGDALGEPAAPGPRHPRNDVVNTNVIGLAGKTWALVEAGSYPVVLSNDLEEQAYSAFDGTLAASYAAHPHRDVWTGHLHAIAYEAGVLDEVRHVVVARDGRVVREESIAVSDGPSIHDCAITENYVLVLDLPVTFSSEVARRGRGFPFRWNVAHPSRVGLLRKNRLGSEIIWCDVDPCYVFHAGNAWEAADGKIMLDVVAYETMFDGDDSGPDGRCVGVERWTIDPSNRQVRRHSINTTAQEFPRYDERRTGQSTRFLYTIGAPNGRAVPPSEIYKHDIDAGTVETHDFGAGHVPGEFVFVPEDDESPENAGWMIGLVIDTATETTDFVVIDARNFSKAAVARVQLPHRVPPGFHGNWIPDHNEASSP